MQINPSPVNESEPGHGVGKWAPQAGSNAARAEGKGGADQAEKGCRACQTASTVCKPKRTHRPWAAPGPSPPLALRKEQSPPPVPNISWPHPIPGAFLCSGHPK
jgi:hypothetical protein